MATPMLTQYEQIKARHRDAILFFRLGDFYEMFGEDAREGARLLGLTLTKRQNIPMCGVPHHAARTYIHRLLKQGRKVAVCEQTSAPDPRQLVEREVVEVLSPGTVFDLDYLDPKSSNFIAALGVEGEHLALTWCDVSTGELALAAYALNNAGAERETILRRELARLSPRELVVQESLLESSETLGGLSAAGSTVVVNRIPDWGYDRRQSFR
ncbi:MAG: DNA mismatch repair protein MutS, partial [Spirochaetales bacterium]|nr:DNA mismatch repair protein MutS [Spirochaetales bacterium]